MPRKPFRLDASSATAELLDLAVFAARHNRTLQEQGIDSGSAAARGGNTESA